MELSVFQKNNFLIIITIQINFIKHVSRAMFGNSGLISKKSLFLLKSCHLTFSVSVLSSAQIRKLVLGL